MTFPKPTGVEKYFIRLSFADRKNIIAVKFKVKTKDGIKFLEMRRNPL